ncbi:MAG: acyl CoA:acetate/3-ketoacid CoA transferase [Deltaproteobacteria bacterium]|nr:MAG: acyl CoA:acetate/3-ketoacid CoA transferase [Deltaproteobacteria bacterium]
MKSSNKKHPFISDLSQGRLKKGKIVSAREAVDLIQNNDTIAASGFVGTGIPEKILIELENKYLNEKTPRDLTLIYTAGIGDRQDKGMNRFGHEGLLKRVIGGHWGLVPKLSKLAMEEKIQAYNLPQGVISHMYRDSAANKPRTITSVGIGTFVDPRIEGGKVNKMTKEEIVTLLNFDGKEYLAYKTFPLNIVIIRGTTADTNGNISMEKEALTLESLSMAMAARNAGGLVIAQVERIAQKNSLHPQRVKIPGILVDCIVKSEPEFHKQTVITDYKPEYSGETRVPVNTIEPLEMDERKIIARRAAFELAANSVVNLGIGMPEGVANIANEEKILDLLTLTAEPGVIGGIPSGGLDFGTATNTEAIIDQPYQFDFYDGGGLDLAFLGMAEADKKGNVNVSRYAGKLIGCGGFINITQNAKKVIYLGTFTAGGLKVKAENGKLEIINEGKLPKFKEEVEQITFSGELAASKNKSVLYITERAVFSLSKDGLILEEFAPGIDPEKDIFPLMDFKPGISKNLKKMDKRIFNHEPMDIKTDILSIPIESRLLLNRENLRFFVNFEGFSVKDSKTIQEIKTKVENILVPFGKKVSTIVNYDNFYINPDIVDEYTEMVKYLVQNYYTGVTRYTTGAFLRMKLGDAFAQRSVAPHIYESRNEAENMLSKII